jgi:hypothetical protein
MHYSFTETVVILTFAKGLFMNDWRPFIGAVATLMFFGSMKFAWLHFMKGVTVEDLRKEMEEE